MTHVSTVSVVQTVVNQNSNLEERTDIKDTRVSQKGTKKIRDGEDSLGVETTNLKKKKNRFVVSLRFYWNEPPTINKS